MIYDLAVIGAGPAGLLAAISAGERGLKVVVLEKNKRPGLKLLTTGGGRCNITNAIYNAKEMASHFGVKGNFLISALSKFGAAEAIGFFNDLGVQTKIEKINQVFPVSNRSTEVLNALIDKAKRHGVVIRTEARVNQIIASNELIEKVVLNSGEEIIAKSYLIATGGRSYPDTGSTGDAYLWLKKLGHEIIFPRPVLAPIIVREKIVKKLEGISLDNIILTMYRLDKKIVTIQGDIVFTSTGLSGPAALDLSRHIIGTDNLTITLDFLPNYSEQELDDYLRDSFARHGTRLFKNSFESLLPPKLQYLLGEILNINPDKTASVISREDRLAVINFLKKFGLRVQSVAGFDKAIITAGGVSLSEVDPKTMKSKIINNLFLAGEVLDLDGPSGGYNLQLCWSTGYVVGQSLDI